ncbi:MAG: hypothetical protein LBS40_07215 [Burkholderiales bacterium]|jgi:type II secretory pathway pseudopilin PulG|nr:hypothetical protein [Burkholderiales bacterium]
MKSLNTNIFYQYLARSVMIKRRACGFSLLELAVIVLILGLLTTLSWRFIAARIQQQATIATHSALEQADWALTGFAMAHTRLPCPDTDNDGNENCDGTGEVGTLPYQTLGLSDARASQIRYGVLRQTTPVPDPEASASDPILALPRTVDLTGAPEDWFYPLVGILNNNITTETELRNAASEIGIALLQDLTTSTPIASRSTATVTAFNVPLGAANALDFCYALRVAEDPPPAEEEIKNHVHVLDAVGTARQVAYALALPGALDMSGDNDLFDGAQTTALAFNTPQQAQTNLNDDRIRAVSLGTLWDRLKCGEAMAAIGHAQPNAATAAVMLYRILFDYEQVLEQAYELAQAQYEIATAGILAMVAGIVSASASISNAVGDVALEGNVASAVAAAAQMVAALIAIAPTINAMEQAAEYQNMAKQRYLYSQILRASAKPLAETLLKHVRENDAKGLYFGKS